MFAKLLAMFVGNRVDRADGHGGVKGALAGLAAERAIAGRLGPFGWFLIGVVALWKMLFGRRKREIRR